MARWIFTALVWLGLPLVGLHAAGQSVGNETAEVMFHGVELFDVTGISSVSANHIINFSRMSKRGGVNVGTSVTIGYDVPWRKVHELLIAAADGVPDILESSPPRVLQLSLDDFYVKYRLIVTTLHPELRIRMRSSLHENIQDRFALVGIEIMSPHYQSNRAGEESTIPDGMEDVC